MSLETILGPNWRTTLTGLGAALSGLLAAVAAAPYELGNVAEIIPPAWKAKFFAASAIAAFILRAWNASLQKDKQVTGADPAAPAKPGVPLPAIVAILIPALCLTGCQPQTPETRAKWAQTGQVLATRAANIAGRVILNAALASVTNQDADFLDSAAHGLRSEIPNIVTSDDVARIVQIWTPPAAQWTHLAGQLADQFAEASKDTPAAVAVEALAIGLNRAAAGDRLP
jgi:hypothetical protein